MSNPAFWSNREAADEKIKRLGELKNLVDRFREIESAIAKLDADSGEDAFFDARRKFRQLELETLFGGRYDKQSAVISIYPGAGGEDAADWARMLFEMFRKYAEKRGWKTLILEEESNRRTLDIRGEYA